MTGKKPSPANDSAVSAQDVRRYLLDHPEFLNANPDILQEADTPARELGDGVLDFQQFMVKNLQQNSKSIQEQYDTLVDYCRDNMSVQLQVHQAAMRIMKVRDIESLLEIISTDLLALFNVDVVRMAMESDLPVDTSYGEQDYSGCVFVPPGTVDEILGPSKNVLLVDDTLEAPFIGFEEIFIDCEGMARSCALLRLDLDTVGKNIILAFGVRHAGRYHSGQGVELLHFLAQVVAVQLDRYLIDLSI